MSDALRGSSHDRPSPDAADVLVVVVSWNPSTALLDLCTGALAAGCEVAVLDNGSTHGLDVLDSCRRAGARVVALEQNLGLARALAEGHHLAENHQWLLTFDQDSVIEPGMVNGLLASPAAADPTVAMIGPRVVDTGIGTVVQGPTEGSDGGSDARLLITSGALTRVSALTQIGGFREDLFIDHVDHDVCLRLRRAGWRLVLEPTVTMRHTIGQMRSHPVAGRVRVRNSHHSPDRQYYKYRNFLLLVRDGTARADTRWALRTGLALSWGPLKIAAFEQQKRAKLRSIFAGVVDGLRGHGGPRPTLP